MKPNLSPTSRLTGAKRLPRAAQGLRANPRSPVTKLPPLLLAVLLQCAPLLKVVQSNSVMASSPLAIVVQWVTAAAVALGGYHAVSGATPAVLITSPTNSVGTNGFNYAYTITQSSTATDSGHAFTASPLPAGFIVTTFQPSGNPPSPAFARITGRPIQFGIWQVHLTATYNNESAVPTNMTLTIYGKPIITNQPVSLTVSPGANATFSVRAGALPAPTYRWRLGTTTLANQTNSSLTLSNVSASKSGDYTVVISNFVGSVTSEVATLTVQLSLRFERLDGQFRMGFTREAGAAYEIVYSDLLPSVVWQTLTNWPPEAAPTATTVDVPTGSPATRFYRIRRSSP